MEAIIRRSSYQATKIFVDFPQANSTGPFPLSVTILKPENSVMAMSGKNTSSAAAVIAMSLLLVCAHQSYRASERGDSAQ
jgi:hypothetical protein